jgi:Rrf2 family iron-sulfur cluster assembly transcriptional regulator
MPIAWRTDYAIRIMFETARLGSDALASIGVIAEKADVPYDFARQIANRLARCGLLTSKRGARGGFSLARPAEEITVLDIFEAMDERPTMSLCTHSDEACGRESFCAAHHAIWLPLDEMIREQLEGLTLADAVEREGRLSRNAS